MFSAWLLDVRIICITKNYHLEANSFFFVLKSCLYLPVISKDLGLVSNDKEMVKFCSTVNNCHIRPIPRDQVNIGDDGLIKTAFSKERSSKIWVGLKKGRFFNVTLTSSNQALNIEIFEEFLPSSFHFIKLNNNSIRFKDGAIARFPL